MKPERLIQYWMESAEKDNEAMERLFASGNYAWCLFVGHLVIEKLLKAHYVKTMGVNYPRIHNLGLIAKQSGLQLSKEWMEKLDFISGFHIEARYSDVKYGLYTKATREFTVNALGIIRETRQWLLANL